jgi:MFS family permease
MSNFPHVPQGRTQQVYFYFGALIFIIAVINPVNYFTDVATSFMVKDQLHASANQVSVFRLITALPVYLAFVFGLARDRWNPFGMKDRGLMVLFGPLSALICVWLAFQPVSWFSLYAGVFAFMLSTRMVIAGYQGLISLVGQEKLMSGRLTTVWQIVLYIPTAACSWLGGFAAVSLKPPQTFMLLAALCLLDGVLGLWKPKAVFENAYDRPEAKIKDFASDVKRLVRHKAIYAPVVIMFLWCFAPGSQTALQYYLTNTLHASDAAYADFNAIFTLAFIPTFLIFGYLCTRVPLKKLLIWGTIIGIPQMIPFLVIHSATGALWLAIPVGLLGGIATGAYYDLAMRSCPAGLQGTLMLMVDGVYYLSQRGGDILGSKIFDSDPKNGFAYCVAAITIVYALILPCIKLVPPHLIATKDGQENPEEDRERLLELEPAIS